MPETEKEETRFELDPNNLVMSNSKILENYRDVDSAQDMRLRIKTER